MADRPSEPFWIIAPESLLNSRSLEAAGNRHEGIGGMIEFQTDRLLVRDVRASDADAFHQYMRRETYWRDVPIEPPTVEFVTSLVNRCIENQSENPRTDYFLAAVDKGSEELVGGGDP